jgi:hypothetical protein
MPELAVIRPGAVFDLGSQRGRSEHQVLPRHPHERQLRLEFVELLLQRPGNVMLEPGPDTADVLVSVPIPRAEQ